MQLSEFFHRKWRMPSLAILFERDGAKFVTLCHVLAVTPRSMSQNLRDLGELGLVMPNPGYGHPLRPEYVVSDKGVAVAAACHDLWMGLKQSGFTTVALTKWTMPVIATLNRHPTGLRFGEIAEHLPQASDASLSAALKLLEKSGLVDRQIEPSRPPSSRYHLAEGTRGIATLTQLLADELERYSVP